MIISIEPELGYRLINYGPVVIVSTFDGEKGNVAAIAWISVLEKSPPLVTLAIAEKHQTFTNLARSGELAINVPTAEQADLTLYCGSISGRKADKLAEGGIKTRPASTIEAPLLSDCAAWLECKVKDTFSFDGHGLVVAQIMTASCREGVLTSDNRWDVKAFPTLHHLGGRMFFSGGEEMEARLGK